MTDNLEREFRPSIGRFLLGIFCLLLFVYLLLTVFYFVIYGLELSGLPSYLLFNLVLDLAFFLILAAILYRYNVVYVFDDEVEGPTLYGFFLQRERIPYKDVLLQDFRRRHLVSRLLFGHVLASRDGKKIHILWLGKEKFGRLLSVIETVSSRKSVKA